VRSAQSVLFAGAAVAIAALTAGAVVRVSSLARADVASPAPICRAVTNDAGTIAAAFLKRAERRDWFCARDLTTAHVHFPVGLPRPLRVHHVFSVAGDDHRLIARVLLGSSIAVMTAYKFELVNVSGRWRVNGFGLN
jgi:hypothetical protein